MREGVDTSDADGTPCDVFVVHASPDTDFVQADLLPTLEAAHIRALRFDQRPIWQLACQAILGTLSDVSCAGPCTATRLTRFITADGLWYTTFFGLTILIPVSRLETCGYRELRARPWHADHPLSTAIYALILGLILILVVTLRFLDACALPRGPDCGPATWINNHVFAQTGVLFFLWFVSFWWLSQLNKQVSRGLP